MHACMNSTAVDVHTIDIGVMHDRIMRIRMDIACPHTPTFTFMASPTCSFPQQLLLSRLIM